MRYVVRSCEPDPVKCGNSYRRATAEARRLSRKHGSATIYGLNGDRLVGRVEYSDGKQTLRIVSHLDQRGEDTCSIIGESCNGD